MPALEVWRLYRGRADCEKQIKELKADFGLDSFVLRDFWATEAALGGDDAQLQPHERVSPCDAAAKGAPDAVNVAPPGPGRGSDVGPHQKEHQADISPGGGTNDDRRLRPCGPMRACSSGSSQ
jgi:hypothetical protein